jgi:hypothetical protein
MPVYAGPDGHEVNVSGEEEVARYVAAGYSLAEKETKTPAKKAAAKPSEK